MSNLVDQLLHELIAPVQRQLVSRGPVARRQRRRGSFEPRQPSGTCGVTLTLLRLECLAEEGMTPEAKARVDIDKLLAQAGWHVCGMGDFNIHAAQGVAIREFPLNSDFGFADHLLYVNGEAYGVIQANKFPTP